MKLHVDFVKRHLMHFNNLSRFHFVSRDENATHLVILKIHLLFWRLGYILFETDFRTGPERKAAESLFLIFFLLKKQTTGHLIRHAIRLSIREKFFFVTLIKIVFNLNISVAIV